MKNILVPASILAGTIIGAGVFSLPFVFKEVGLATGFFYLAFFCFIYIFIYFLYADIAVRTPGEHRFIGYAEIYFGRIGFWAAIFIALLQLFVVLVIYLILAPSFFKLLLSGSETFYLAVFWLICSVVIMLDIKRAAIFESLIVSGVVIIIAVIFFLGLGGFLSSDIPWGGIDISKFLAVGPILFALAGILTVPEVISYFREANIPISFARKSLVIGAVVPVIAYGAFVLGIIGLSESVSVDAISGLAGNIPAPYLVLLGVLGSLSLMGSYVLVGIIIRKMLNFDLHLSKLLSMVLTIVLPISFYFIGLRDFISSISFVGGIFLPIEIIFIIFMWLQMDKKSEMPPTLAGKYTKLLISPILVVFSVILIYEIIPHP